MRKSLAPPLPALALSMRRLLLRRHGANGYLRGQRHLIKSGLAGEHLSQKFRRVLFHDARCQPVIGTNRRVQFGAQTWCANLSVEIGVIQPKIEPWIVAFGPLEIIEQTPDEKATHIEIE